MRITAEEIESVEFVHLRVYLCEAEYSGDGLILNRYLETLHRPIGLSDSQYQQLRKKSRQFFVRDRYLFKRTKKGLPPRRVIGLIEQKLKVMKELHDEIGHCGQQMIYQWIVRRYQWWGMYNDVEKYVKSCEICQKRLRGRLEEPLYPTWSN